MLAHVLGMHSCMLSTCESMLGMQAHVFTSHMWDSGTGPKLWYGIQFSDMQPIFLAVTKCMTKYSCATQYSHVQLNVKTRKYN